MTQHFDIHCEVIILRTTVSSDKDANTYKCDSDAQTISDQSLPDVIVSLPTLSKIVDDIMAGKEVSDQQAAEARAYFGLCKCVTDEVIKARGTRKDENGKDIPKPPLVADADIVCEPPCVKVWTHWCYQGAYKEIKRWCEVEKTTDKSTLFRTEYEHQIVIKVLLEGWFELGWRVRCVTAAESKEAQELVNGGLLTPEGNPVGHYRPDWLPPVTQNPLPDNCCLVITDMAISSIRPCRIGEFNYGHVFDVIIDYEWVTGSGPAPILEWHEYSDNFPAWQEPLGVSDNAWNDQFDKINKSPVFDDWKRAFPKVCRPGDSGQIKLHDVPTLGWKAPPPQVTEDRQLWIKVRTVDCNKVERAVCLYQSLSTKADGSHSGKAVEYACDKSKPASGDAPPSPDDMVVVKEANYDDQLRGVESCK
ncbi:MAG: hypothetical protein IT205_10510 [Fimbriimonadaceae bacterium]|nr:hypothetical protein [Fimbriimonadaceae bacterium]